MSRNQDWTEAEKLTLAKFFPTTTTKQVAEMLGREIGSVYAAATRFGIKKVPSTQPTKTARIIEACKPNTGLTVGELGKATGESNDFCNTIAHLLCRERRLFKAGLFKHTRYFVTQEAADAWNAQAAQEREAALAESKRQKMKARNLARKLERAAKPKPEPKPKKGQKPAKALVVCARAATKTIAPQQTKPAKVIMPDSVKVQVIPTPPSRFHFEPPPGWRGQITHDWMDRRLQGVQA